MSVVGKASRLDRRRRTHDVSHDQVLARMLTPEQLADLLQVRVRLLADWRQRDVGPPWGKIGHYARYDPRDVRRWFNEVCRRDGGLHGVRMLSVEGDALADRSSPGDAAA